MYYNRSDPECVKNAHYRYIRNIFYIFLLSTSSLSFFCLMSNFAKASTSLLIVRTFMTLTLFVSVFYGFRLSMEIYFTFLMPRDQNPYNIPPSHTPTTVNDNFLRLFKACDVVRPTLGEREPWELNKENSFYKRRQLSIEKSPYTSKSGNSNVSLWSNLSDWESSPHVDNMWESLGFDLIRRKKIEKSMRFFICSQILKPLYFAFKNQIFSHVFSCESFVDYAMDFPTDKEYFLGRIERMTRDPHMFDFVWNGGGDFSGFPWSETNLPTDSAIVFHLFCRFMDVCVTPFNVFTNSDEKFSVKHVLLSPVAGGSNDGVYLQQVRIKPPCYCVVDGGAVYETDKGCFNLFETVGLFFVLVNRDFGGWIGTKSVVDVVGREINGWLR